MTFRMYYKGWFPPSLFQQESALDLFASSAQYASISVSFAGDKLDPDLPPPTLPVPIVVPTQRPSANGQNGHFLYNNAVPAAGGSILPNSVVGQKREPPSAGEEDVSSETGPAAQRQRILKEVRDHLELLKQFDGVIPVEEINRRKHELFLALPPAPPPSSAFKRSKA